MNGQIIQMHFIHAGVIIEGSDQTYLVGSLNATITCVSDTDTEKMEWLRDDDVVIALMLNTTQLNLTFSPVNDSVHGKLFTCKVTRNTTVVEQNFIMSVAGALS